MKKLALQFVFFILCFCYGFPNFYNYSRIYSNNEILLDEKKDRSKENFENNYQSLNKSQPGPRSETSDPKTNPLLLYCTSAIAVINLFWTFYIYNVQRENRGIDRLNQIRGDFVSKSIILPVCIEPLKEFILEQSEKLKKLHSGETPIGHGLAEKKYNEYLREFKQNKEILINKFLVIGSFCHKTYIEISNILDEIDDYVTEHCYLQSHQIEGDNQSKYFFKVVQKMYLGLKDIVIIITDRHDAFFHFDQSYESTSHCTKLK